MSDDVRGDMTMDEYEFPTSRLRRRIEDSERTPLVLIACGSFSPITFLHLRMFEMAADYARFNSNFEVVGAYLSCVGDAYKKTGLVKAEHRINMCSSAVGQSSWISVDPWEALHGEYLETAKVLDHFEHEINGVLDGVETPNGRKKCRIALLAGADLIQTMSTPGVWAPKDIDYILKNFGAFIVEVSCHKISFARDLTLTAFTAHGHRHRRSSVFATTVERQHLGHPAACTERHLIDQDPPVPPQRHVNSLSRTRTGGAVHRGQQFVR